MPTATYSVNEVAQLLGIGTSAAYAAAKRNELPVQVIRIGGRIVIPRKPLDELLGITPDPQEVA
ncbi:helix-turn-helix domain-containing protein [Corynebacterium variabile]|uniref:helix-turn-helix domain-containing protein n=1 Tax=Corynebacterium variabile TaxID=1727 RepID=UPI00289B5CC1|nr:helix-turn-helix domain-containing protein [Corynebacterium variabile]